MSITTELAALFNRDLDRLIHNLEEMEESNLWKVPKGVTNSCGVLVQHITGNLNHFIGTALGDTGYIRERDREFTNTGRPREDLLKELKNLQEMISVVLNSLDEEKLDREYPLATSYDFNVREMLLHLYGHLSYHTGQLNYLRRILNEE